MGDTEPQSFADEYLCVLEEDTEFAPQPLPGSKEKAVSSTKPDVEVTNQSQSDRYLTSNEFLIQNWENALNAQQNEPAVFRANIDVDTPESAEFDGDQDTDMVTDTFHQFQSSPPPNRHPNERGRVRDIRLARRVAFNHPKPWDGSFFPHKKPRLSEWRANHPGVFSSVVSSQVRNTEPKE